MMNRHLVAVLLLASFSLPQIVRAQPNEVVVFHDDRGWKLQVDGKDFMVFGMNWGYIPIGQNYSYSLWDQSDAFIMQVLDNEMALMRDMGINAIRLFSDIPPRWVEYIYEKYGIMSAVNHLMGRYGFEVNGIFVPNTDYGDAATRRAILDDLRATVERYRDTRGVLIYLLGNENNYGLAWTGFEIQDLPEGASDPRAEHLYSLMGEAATLVKNLDDKRPVALANGDIQYLDVIARTCKDIDAMGGNVYRGISSGDLFERVRQELGVPFIYTEFGADAYDARLEKEDDVSQAGYLLGQWREIYEQSHGKGKAGTSIGGFIFQWSDGWWKFRQEENLDVHDTNASWVTAAYPHDYVEGRNNMNEEWWGITAKNWPDEHNFATVTPRTAYYVLQEAFALDPYAPTTSAAVIAQHFGSIRVAGHIHHYATGRALSEVERLSAVRLSNVRMHYESSVSRGNAQTERGEKRLLGHTESFWTAFEINPKPGASAKLSLHGVGAVAQNRLDNVFYETRALETAVPEAGEAPSREVRKIDDRFAVYRAEFAIEQPEFALNGFFRTGHFHWGYEGDFFGLYPEANYGPNLDIYNGQAPIGLEFTGKGATKGLKVAVGPELWWGANAAVLVKYYRTFGTWRYALIHHEDIVEASGAQTSFAVPEPLNRRSTLYFGYDSGPVTLELGGIFSGSTKVGDRFTWVEKTDGSSYLNSGYAVIDDEVRWGDTVGGRARITYDGAPLRWYGQGSLMGPVADGGYNHAILLTGWTVKESGRGNHWAVSTGVSTRAGFFEIAPQFLYQKPIIPANPKIDDFYNRVTGMYYPAVRPRNIIDDPFIVRDNRETIAGELLLVYDPTPGTWFHTWDRDIRENADFVAALDIWYRHQPEQRDANTFTLGDGSIAAFGAAPPAEDVWEVKLHTVHNPSRDVRVVSTLLAGEGQARGEDSRLIRRYGVDMRTWWRTLRIDSKLHFDDWGPYDFHRDFNLTYPLQWYLDASYGLAPAGLEGLGTRFGVRAQFRTLDENSAEFASAPDGSNERGRELEIGIYVNVSM